MAAAGSVWRRRCQVLDGPEAQWNEIIVLGEFEQEIRLRPLESHGPIITATEKSLRESYELIAHPPAGNPEDTLLTQAGEWVKL